MFHVIRPVVLLSVVLAPAESGLSHLIACDFILHAMYMPAFSSSVSDIVQYRSIALQKDPVAGS